MNSYEQKQAARAAGLRERADRARETADVLHGRARDMSDAIPFGQPILIGHHSEGRDRRYRDRIQNTYRSAFDELDKAKHYAAKAEAVGTGGISSDDPDAIDKLRAELAAMEASQERMKAANKALRASKTPETRVAALVALGFTEKQAAKLLEEDRSGNWQSFPRFALSNNSANMRRVQNRIAALTARRMRQDVEIIGPGYVYREDVADNRLSFEFDGKPSAEIRALLKTHAFKWSPSRSLWVRQLTPNARYAAKAVCFYLDAAAHREDAQ